MCTATCGVSTTKTGGSSSDDCANNSEKKTNKRANEVFFFQKGRSWGCKFYEKLRSKHCKLRCFMASTCLKPR